MQSILPPPAATEIRTASIDVEYSHPHHAAFTIDGEVKRSLTLANFLKHAGFVLHPTQRFRIAVELLCLVLCFSFAAAAADEPQTFPRGATRSPAHHLLAAPTHRVLQSPPPQFALVPAKLDMWGNDQYGDCVTAEEAFAKACYSPEIFVDPNEVVAWARRHGYLHGADLATVMQTMQRDGFQVGGRLFRGAGQQYDDGPYASVDYSSETVLQSAIATGPVKIAIEGNALPGTAGKQQGWYTTDCGQKFPNTDHCVSLCGYGPADYLYTQLNVPLPAALPAATPGYLLFTWSSIGFVTHDWLMTTCAEAWVRNPTTVGNPPLGPTPAPGPATTSSLSFSEVVQLVIASKSELTSSQAAAVASFFADDASPRVSLLKNLVYRRAVEAGLVPAGTEIGAVNWQQLIAIVVELEPIIVPLIPVLFGEAHASPQSPVPSPFALCATEYRTECTPFGCRRVRVEVEVESRVTPKSKIENPKSNVSPQPCATVRRRPIARPFALLFRPRQRGLIGRLRRAA